MLAASILPAKPPTVASSSAISSSIPHRLGSKPGIPFPCLCFWSEHCGSSVGRAIFSCCVVAFPAFYFCKCRSPGRRLSRLQSVRAPEGRSCIFVVHLDHCTHAGAGLVGGLLMHKPFPFPYCSTSHCYSSFPYSTWKGLLSPCLHLPIAIAYGKVFLLLGILPDAIPAPAAQPDTICMGMGTTGLEVGSHSVAAAAFCPRGLHGGSA